MKQRIAISIWQDRISPVLDSSSQILLIDFNENNDPVRQLIFIPQQNIFRKVEFLKGLNIEKLICGAVSSRMHELMSGAGFEVIPFMRGSIERILNAYINDELLDGSFYQPGCRGRFGNPRGKRCRRNGKFKNQIWEKK